MSPPPIPTVADPALPDRDRWFTEQVQPHEASLRTWLGLRFPALTDIDDLVQESLVRVWRSPRTVAQLSNPRSFLFTIARNAAMDCFRRRRVVPLEPLLADASESVPEERPSIPEALNSAQELALLHEAIAALPARCRTIMTLQKIHGKANAEIARELGLSIHTVNAQLVNGLIKCRQYLKERGVLRGRMQREEAP